MSRPELHDELRDLLEQSGQIALSCFRSVRVELKADATMVTEADRAVEAALVSGLSERFPEHGVVGEEGGRRPGLSTWYVDPIDGTQSFVEGLAHWGPSLGLVDERGVAVGATWFPRIQEFWFFERGRGAWLDGRRLPRLEPRAAGPRDVVYLPSRFHRYFDLAHPGKTRGLGATAAHLALVAGGSAIGAFTGAGWKPWDVAAGLGMLEEVGGVARTLDGRPVHPVESHGRPFMAGNPVVVAALLDGIRFRGQKGDG